MSQIDLRFYTPIVSGTPTVQPTIKPSTPSSAGEKNGFKAILTEQLEKNSTVNFSKHAVKRALDHNIDLSNDKLSRLNEGVRIAGEKNLEDPLILVGGVAFVVNIPSNVVITAMDSSETQGNVFTNIDGTVII